MVWKMPKLQGRVRSACTLRRRDVESHLLRLRLTRCSSAKGQPGVVELFRLVGRPDQWSRGDVETQLLASRLPFVELLGVDVAINLHVPLRWLQILAQRDDSHASISEVHHGLMNLLCSLSESEHDRRLRDDIWAHLLCMAQHVQRLLVTCATISD